MLKGLYIVQGIELEFTACKATILIPVLTLVLIDIVSEGTRD